MKFKTKFKLMLFKKYFDTGFGVTNYLKYLIAFGALATKDLRLTLIVGFVYAIACFIIGYFWIKWRFFEAEQEVSNVYNLFVKQMRRKKFK